jgi:hypothetical protein
MPASNHVAFTAPINPPSASPTLTIPQVWACLERKIRAGQDFVGGAITDTTVLKEYTTPEGYPVTDRLVHFKDTNMGKKKETCVAYKPMKVEFLQGDGGKVQNIVSEGAGGEGKGDLYMTYAFDWVHKELEGDEKALEERKAQEKKMAKVAVESTIEVMRRMVRDGTIQ